MISPFICLMFASIFAVPRREWACGEGSVLQGQKRCAVCHLLSRVWFPLSCQKQRRTGEKWHHMLLDALFTLSLFSVSPQFTGYGNWEVCLSSGVVFTVSLFSISPQFNGLGKWEVCGQLCVSGAVHWGWEYEWVCVWDWKSEKIIVNENRKSVWY